MLSKLILIRLLCFALTLSVAAPVVFAQDTKTTRTKRPKKKKKVVKEPEPEVEPEEEPEPEPEPDAAAEEAEPEPEPEADPDAELVFSSRSIADVEAEARAKKEAAERIPRESNFSTVGLVLDSAALATGGLLIFAGQDLTGWTSPSLGAPLRDSVDYDIALKFHGDLADGSKFLFGAGDIAGYAVVGVPALALGTSYLWLKLNEEGVLATQSRNVDHAFWGFYRTMAWTALTVGIAKTFFARERPYQALARDAYGESDTNDSFMSTLTTFAFASAAYSSWGLSDWMIHDLGYSALTARLISFGSFYGLSAIAGVAQVYQQEAFPSDVFAGALVGSLIGNLVYVSHFNELGVPNTALSATPWVGDQSGGVVLSGSW